MDGLPATLDATKVVEGVDLLALFILDVVVSYALALLLSHAVKRLLGVKEVENFLVRYGAMASKMWQSTVAFIAQYIGFCVSPA